jgi:hypothetical protein
MIDFLHLPKPQNGYIDYFPGFSTTTGGQWQVWNKPRGISFIKIITIAGGGGGGGANGTTSGGAGGGSSGVSNVMIPAIFLPDRLYVSSGVGGAGGNGSSGTSSTAGDPGIASYVSIAQSTAFIYVICYANPGSGGGPGGNVGGSGATVASIGGQSGQGNFTALAGQAGADPGLSITYPTTGLLLSGGAGGGHGAGFTAGVITAPASQTSTYRIFPTTTAVTGSTDGAAGIENFQLLLSTGGSGGGALGGDGGAGGFGSGGGGGGAANSAGTGGNGGDGGDGLVIISCW